MAKPPFGILLVTGGRTHQENYGAGFLADPRAKVIGLTDEADVDADRARLNRQAASAWGVPVLPDLDEALARPDVHAVSVCCEFERRARVAERCALAGRHIYLDKPMATTVESARSLVDAVHQAGVRSQMFTQVGFGYALRAKRALESGELGDLQAIHCDLMFAKGFPGSAPLGQPRREHYPPKRFTFPDAKREIWTTAVYSLTLIRWLTGRDFRSVYAKTANYFFRHHHERDIEDFGTLALTLDGGLTATITAGRIGWQSHSGSGPNLTRLLGSKGSLLIDAHQPRIEVASARVEWRPPNPNPDDPMGFWSSTQAAARTRPKKAWTPAFPVETKSDQSMFLDCLEEEKDAEVTAADAAMATEALLAAYKSAATGEVVELPLV